MRQEPVIIADVRADDPLAHASQELAGGRPEAPVRTYIRSWLMVPLVTVFGNAGAPAEVPLNE